MPIRRLLTLLIAFALFPTSGAAASSRLVSLDVCMDWLLVYHLPAEQVAALSPVYADSPLPGVDKTPPLHDGSLESIVALAPEQVLVGQYNASMLRERLRQLGFQVTVLPLPMTLGDLVEYEQRFLRAIGLPETQARPASKPYPPTGKRLLLLEANGIGMGRHTFENELIEYAGWTNYLTDSGLVRLDLEQVAQNPPDAILWASPEHPAVANRFAEHPVLRKLVPPEHWLSTESWRWTCPGPWTWDLIEQLAK